MAQWNPWHGCRKLSPGCQHCYVYRMDARYEKDASDVKRNAAFNLPVRKNRKGNYKLPAGEKVYTCFSSDFFLEEADEWRAEAWQMMHQRPDLHFFIITKRINRFMVNLPGNWGDGYDNVTIGSTCENQDRANFRVPYLIDMPIMHKAIICEPMLGAVDLSKWLCREIEMVVAGGESGEQARECNFDWVMDLRQQCINADVPFYFKQTGARFIKNGKTYLVKRQYQHSQARRAGINFKLE